MPGFTIHIAIANEYTRKHSKEILDEKAFIKGTIDPDLSDNKYESHYGNYAENHVGLSNFIEQTQIDINSDYGKGYFLHLLADELFYHNVFEKETQYVRKNHLKTFYHDYDCLNKRLFKHYHIRNVPEEAKKYAKELKEKPELLTYRKIKKLIHKLSQISIEKQINEINKNGNPIY